MASGNNSTTLYCTQGKGYGLGVSFNENSTNIGANTSNVSISAWFNCPSSHWSSNYNSYLRVYWHDNHDNIDRLISETAFTSTYTGQTINVGGTIDVAHNNDGGLSGYAFATFTQGSSSGGWCPSSGSVSTGWVALTTIPRASTINSFNGTNIEGNFSVNYTSYYSGFTNKLRISIPSVKALQTKNYSSGSSFTLDSSSLEYLYSYMANTNSVKLGAVIETWNGSTKIGESAELINVCTITNANPTFNDFTYKDTNSKVTAVTGNDQVLFKGLSTLLATISSANKMIANKGATAKNYVAIIDNINKSADYSTSDLNIDLGAVTSSGTKILNIRDYDSRNNSTLVYKDITVYDYDKPVINASVTRLNNFENQTTLKVSGTYSKLTINDTDKNKVKTLQYRYRESGGTWSSWKALTSTIADGKFSCSDVVLSLDNTKAFDFEVQAIDNLETNTLSLKLDIGQAIFFISSNKKACYINGQEILTYDVVDSW